MLCGFGSIHEWVFVKTCRKNGKLQGNWTLFTQQKPNQYKSMKHQKKFRYTLKKECNMKLIPLFDKVVLKPVNEEKTSNILLPKDMEEKPEIAQVVATGPGGNVDGEQVTMVLQVGDKVLFNKFAGFEFNLNNTTYILMKQTDILAKIEN